MKERFPTVMRRLIIARFTGIVQQATLENHEKGNTMLFFHKRLFYLSIFDGLFGFLALFLGIRTMAMQWPSARTFIEVGLATIIVSAIVGLAAIHAKNEKRTFTIGVSVTSIFCTAVLLELMFPGSIAKLIRT